MKVTLTYEQLMKPTLLNVKEYLEKVWAQDVSMDAVVSVMEDRVRVTEVKDIPAE